MFAAADPLFLHPPRIDPPVEYEKFYEGKPRTETRARY